MPNPRCSHTNAERMVNTKTRRASVVYEIEVVGVTYVKSGIRYLEVGIVDGGGDDVVPVVGDE
jgi:hypothetical protein